MKSGLLPPLCRGETFATVGISHLTTSRQHLAQPAVTAVEASDELRAERDGSLGDRCGSGRTHRQRRHAGRRTPGAHGRPTRRWPASRSQPPMRLLALSASQTATLAFNDVRVPRRNLVAGPVEHVMRHGGGGAGSLTTSALAVGLTSRHSRPTEGRGGAAAGSGADSQGARGRARDAAHRLYSAARHERIRHRAPNRSATRPIRSCCGRPRRIWPHRKGPASSSVIRPSALFARRCSSSSGPAPSRSSRRPCANSPA